MERRIAMSRQYSLEEKMMAKECARLVREYQISLEEAYEKMKVPKDDHRLTEEEIEEILLSFY